MNCGATFFKLIIVMDVFSTLLNYLYTRINISDKEPGLLRQTMKITCVKPDRKKAKQRHQKKKKN
jgi:hypothetical protein